MSRGSGSAVIADSTVGGVRTSMRSPCLSRAAGFAARPFTVTAPPAIIFWIAERVQPSSGAKRCARNKSSRAPTSAFSTSARRCESVCAASRSIPPPDVFIVLLLRAGRRGADAAENLPRIVDIALDLSRERIRRGEFFFFANSLDEVHLDLPAVEVLIEIEHVALNRLRTGPEGRIDADARRRLPAPAVDLEERRVDAVERHRFGLRLDVGGGKTHIAAAAVAGDDAAGDEMIAAEILRRQAYLPAFDETANTAAAHAMAVDLDGPDHADLEAELFSPANQVLDAPLSRLAEAEVLADPNL